VAGVRWPGSVIPSTKAKAPFVQEKKQLGFLGRLKDAKGFFELFFLSPAVAFTVVRSK
jgi:hypothetical protein